MEPNREGVLGKTAPLGTKNASSDRGMIRAQAADGQRPPNKRFPGSGPLRHPPTRATRSQARTDTGLTTRAMPEVNAEPRRHHRRSPAHPRRRLRTQSIKQHPPAPNKPALSIYLTPQTLLSFPRIPGVAPTQHPGPGRPPVAFRTETPSATPQRNRLRPPTRSPQPRADSTRSTTHSLRKSAAFTRGCRTKGARCATA